MPMFEQETFGPPAAVVKARDAAHAVELADASRYGFGGNLRTRGLQCTVRLAAQLAAAYSSTA